MIRSNSDVLPWSTWPRKVTIGGRGSSFAGSSSCFQRLEHLSLRGRPARWKSTSHAQLRRPAVRPFPGRAWRRCCSSCPVPAACQDGAGGHADGLGEAPHRAGQFDDDVLAPRRGGVGAGAAGCACVCRSGADGRRSSSSSSGFRRRGGGRLLAFQLPLLAAAEGDGALLLLLATGATARPPRRGRSRPAARRLAGRRRGGSAAAALARRAPWRASAAIRFCSCLRRCSESGLVPALLARMASAGSLMSGFCGAGSLDFRPQRRLRRRRHGASLMAGPGPAPRSFSRSFCRWLLAPPLGFFLARRRLRFRRLAASSARDCRRFAAARRRAAPPVSSSAAAASRPRGKHRDRAGPCPPGRCSLRGGTAGAAAGASRARPGAGRRPAALAAVDERHDRRHLLVGQAGQRRALPRDTCLGADVDQHLAVELQLFR